MATKREKQLAIQILKERIEHVTGKKVIFEDYKKNPETGILEGENTLTGSGLTITLGVPGYVEEFCEEKGIKDIAAFYKEYVGQVVDSIADEENFLFWAEKNADLGMEGPLDEGTKSDIITKDNPEVIEEALWGMLPNDFQKAKELIVQILKNPKIEGTMKPDFKTIWDQAKPLFLKWHDNTGKELQRQKEQQQAFQTDIKTIGEIMKPLADAFGKTKKPVMGGPSNY